MDRREALLVLLDYTKRELNYIDSSLLECFNNHYKISQKVNIPRIGVMTVKKLIRKKLETEAKVMELHYEFSTNRRITIGL